GKARALSVSGAEAVAVVGTGGTIFLGGSESWEYDLPDEAVTGQPVFGRDEGGVFGVVTVTSAGEIMLLLDDGMVSRVDVATLAAQFAEVLPGDQLNDYPVLADLDSDGRLDVIATFGRTLFAFTQGGAVVSGFPIRLTAPVVAQPLVAGFSNEGWSVIVASTDGYIYAYDPTRRGKQVPGFPLAVGERIEATPLLTDNSLYAISVSGSLQAWQLDNLDEIWWGELYGNDQNQSFVELTREGEVDQAPPPLIDAVETYNWPNPIQDGITHLRTRTGFDSRVEITIIDAVGGLVAELEMNTRAGVPSEIVWEANVESGLYFARFTATSVDGVKATKLVKMAVIR
ncbi:MAG TPA: hypothetical protein VMO47_01990, partial [Rhodothermales bacterium]|nr:hypothetical protein [Rhodothermales bacterium]